MSDFVKELNFDGDTFNDMKRDCEAEVQPQGNKPDEG